MIVSWISWSVTHLMIFTVTHPHQFTMWASMPHYFSCIVNLLLLSGFWTGDRPYFWKRRWWWINAESHIATRSEKSEFSNLNSPKSSLTAIIFCFLGLLGQSRSSSKYAIPSFSVALWTLPNAPSPNNSRNSVLIGGISQPSKTSMSFAVL